MCEVTRYDLTEDVNTGVVDITPVPNSMEGRYVTFEDYAEEKHRADQNAAHLETLTERMLAENVALKGFFETGINASFEGCDFFGDHMQSRALELGLIRDAVYCKDQHENLVVDPGNFEDGDTVFFINETPATDVILNEVRAQAISNALDSCSACCDTDCVMDALDISYEDAELRSNGAIELHDGLAAIATQLRAGSTEGGV